MGHEEKAYAFRREEKEEEEMAVMSTVRFLSRPGSIMAALASMVRLGLSSLLPRIQDSRSVTI